MGHHNIILLPQFYEASLEILPFYDYFLTSVVSVLLLMVLLSLFLKKVVCTFSIHVFYYANNIYYKLYAHTYLWNRLEIEK